MCGKVPPGFDVAALGYDFHGRRRMKQMIEYAAIVDFRFRLLPFDCYLVQGFLGLVGIFMECGNQIPVSDDFNAIYFFGRPQVYTFQDGIMGRRPQNFGIQHSGQTHVS